VSSGIKVTPNESPATPRVLAWRVATVERVIQETAHARTLVLNIPEWPGHRAGQHVDVRLVAEDGYQAQRSYSIASAPEDDTVRLTIERLEDGEVSPYLCDVLAPGDGVEVRGPIGGYFVWDASVGGPLVLIGGGSGVVPLMAMLRHHENARADGVAVRLLYSARMWDDVIYREELARHGSRPGVDVRYTLTRGAPVEWTGYRRRIDRAMLEEVVSPPLANPRIFVCGPTPLVESVANILVDLGHEPQRIRTERFGPTG
jgi:ferredoxin-NADP reductase